MKANKLSKLQLSRKVIEIIVLTVVVHSLKVQVISSLLLLVSYFEMFCWTEELFLNPISVDL